MEACTIVVTDVEGMNESRKQSEGRLVDCQRFQGRVRHKYSIFLISYTWCSLVKEIYRLR